MRDYRSLLPADAEFISCHRHIGFLHQFVERLGRHPITKQDADKRQEALADRCRQSLGAHRAGTIPTLPGCQGWGRWLPQREGRGLNLRRVILYNWEKFSHITSRGMHGPFLKKLK